MRLLGLDAPSLALALAATGTTILLLHLLRRPRSRIVVPALFLWEALVPDHKHASRLRQSLRRVFSLLLALAIASTLLLTLADPERAAGRASRNLVILLDRSASMAARDVAPSRFEKARQRARELVTSMSNADRALLVALDSSATALTALTSDRSALLRALAELAESDATGDLLSGVRLGSDLLAAQPNAELLLLSDGNLEHVEAARAELARHPHMRVRFEPIGHAARNVAITRFAVRRYPLDKRHQESLVAVTNFGPSPEPVTLRIKAGDVPLAEQPLALASGQTLTHTLPELPSTDAVLEASIVLERGPDALVGDDRAYANVPSRARTRVLAVTEGNRFLDAALLLDEYFVVRELSPDAYRDATGYDVVIFDRVLPARPPALPTLYLGAPRASAPGYPLVVGALRERPFFEKVARDHPLVRGLALADVNIARAPDVELASGDVAIASSVHGPLLIEGKRDGVPFIALGFDIEASDLPLRPAWPLLLLRALDRLTQSDDESAQPVHTAGEPFALSFPADVKRARLIGPDGDATELVVEDGTARVVCERAGVHKLAVQGHPERLLAVRIPAEREGAIAPRRDVVASASPARAEVAAGSWLEGRLWPLLASCAALLSLFEWLAFHRRWTE